MTRLHHKHGEQSSGLEKWPGGFSLGEYILYTSMTIVIIILEVVLLVRLSRGLLP